MGLCESKEKKDQVLHMPKEGSDYSDNKKSPESLEQLEIFKGIEEKKRIQQEKETQRWNQKKKEEMKIEQERLAKLDQTKQENEEFEDYFMGKREKYIRNFDPSKNVGYGATNLKMKSITRWTNFETRMPFYTLDVSCFYTLLFAAQKITTGDDGSNKLNQNKHVTLESLQIAFQENELWVSHLQPDTMMIKFLDDTCLMDEETYGKGAYDVRKLQCFGLIWCKGVKAQKIMELYEILQDEGQTDIYREDDDDKGYLYMLFYISCEMVVKYEEQVGGKVFQGIKIEHIESTKDEYYKAGYEKFQKDVFGDEEVLNRVEWEKKVLKKADWVIDAKNTRDNLGYADDQGKEKKAQKKEIKEQKKQEKAQRKSSSQLENMLSEEQEQDDQDGQDGQDDQDMVKIVEDGQDGQDGEDGQDGLVKMVQDGQDGQNDQDGLVKMVQDGQDGQNDQDGLVKMVQDGQDGQNDQDGQDGQDVQDMVKMVEDGQDGPMVKKVDDVQDGKLGQDGEN